MARQPKDLFGFDELEKAFIKCEKKYPDEADALLMAMGQAVNKTVKRNTAVKTKRLRNSWRLKKVKLYNQGTVRVVRVQSSAPHAHLYEYGHKIVPRGSGRNRRTNKSSSGFVEGRFVLQKAIDESRNRFSNEVENMLDKLTGDLQV